MWIRNTPIQGLILALCLIPQGALPDTTRQTSDITEIFGDGKTAGSTAETEATETSKAETSANETSEAETAATQTPETPATKTAEDEAAETETLAAKKPATDRQNTVSTKNSGQAGDIKPAEPVQADKTRAAALVWDTRTGIVTPGIAGRVVHVFGASIPTLVCQPGMVCLMELEAGEEVLDTPVQADPARWRVEMRHRDTPVAQTYFAFKPSEDAAARSNFVVLTDRRVYVVNLVKDFLRSTYILSFDYPDSRAAKMAENIKTQKASRDSRKAANNVRRASDIARTGVRTSKGAVPASELDFNYNIMGTAPFNPLRVYNDGRKTYVDLPAGYRGDLPVLIGGSGQDNKAFNYRVKNGSQIIVDRVLHDFKLQDGRRKIHIRRGS